MELCDWEECSVELASYFVHGALGVLANRRIDDEEKLKFPRHVAGSGWNTKAT